MPVVHDANPKANESAQRQQSSASDPSELARDGVQPLLAPDDARPHVLRMLLSSARHELGSPLQLIQGFAELLASGAYGALSEEQRGLLNHVLTASGELRNVVEACLELAELELIGGTRASPAPLDLRQALAETLEHVRKQRGLLAQL